ncbi:hypothetical protein THRCLA_02310 [Thraustotheca clavata]|uniref:WW domain-containing protein n=1 Tax=Thraustotheca clavata TaxID=74557 RepID=A0A1W0A6C3_9STRA|nr:hypothetical protein THRCLA_02310 [Thraustotheca clavata]
MLFGGRLSGIKLPPTQTVEAPSIPKEDHALPTPHTDLITKLTDHELRLLDELNRTRHKLEAEIKLKESDRLIKPPTNQERHVKDRLDMLPILTNLGETPFEVGLRQGQHVLPVFKLPPVTGATRIVTESKTPTPRSEDEISLSQMMTDEDRILAMQALGMTAEELQILEQTASCNTKSLSSIGEASISKSSPKLPHIPNRKRKITNTRQRQCNKSTGLQKSAALRNELEQALRRVQSFTTLVKQDLIHAQQICPVQSIRGEMFVKKWGLAKINSICTKLLYAKVHSAFEKWVIVTMFIKQQQARAVLLQFKGSRRLDLFFSNWTKRRMAEAWNTWFGIIAAEKAQLRREREAEAIFVLQRSWRNYHSRFMYNAFRTERKRKREYAAACKIQAFARGQYARTNAKQIVLEMKQNFAATKFQAVCRGHLTRKSLYQAKRDRVQLKAARSIQARVRGRQARQKVAKLKYHLRCVAAASTIQRKYRGRLHKVKHIRAMIERERRRQAIQIQRMIRGDLARRRAIRVREQRRMHFVRQNKAAVQIQAHYRGHRGRLATQFKLEARRTIVKQQNKAAVLIQSLYRQRKAVRAVAAHKAARLDNFVNLAREWTQFWSDDANAFFFYSNQTGEAVWEPPEDGYTKVNGRDLVLKDGNVILDPVIAEQEEAVCKAQELIELELQRTAEEAEAQDALCVECEEIEASRRCAQCEDVFCDSCYTKTHSSGKRALHTWTPMGPIKCIECEKLKATRWCETCQDPYCLGCYNIIHAKGKKAMHTWIDMVVYKQQLNGRHQSELVQAMMRTLPGAASVEDPQTYNEFIMSSDYDYINQGIVHGGQNDYTEQSDYIDQSTAMQQTEEQTTEWIAAVDQESGELYYYNTMTGDTQWAQ